MHNYEATFRKMPPIKNGAGNLSWRVALAPYLEQDALYNSFKHDEPWDSEHNKKLLEKMPKVYEIPGRPAPPGHTYLRVITGPHTIYEEGKKMTLARIQDGTSNTLLVVEAEKAVPWTSPDELVYDPKGPLPKLGNPAKGGAFLAGFADAVVRVIHSVDEETLRAIITADGGEPVDFDKLK
jgi:hypothetical protein